MIPKELLKKIRRIEIRTSRTVNDVLAGHYHSVFKGLGMEFEEVRQYQIGDDVRTIDWNVSARYGEPYVKIFREERELTVILLVDLSASHAFGTASQLKRDLVAEVCATLAFSAIRNKGTKHVLRVIREVLYHQPVGSKTDITAALEHLNRTVKRRAVVFVVSDFQAGGYDDALRIARRRHDVIPIVVTDPREMELPDVGLIELFDGETGETVLVDSSSRTVRDGYAMLMRRLAEQRDGALRSMAIDSIHVRTGESFVDPLTRFFRAREKRL
jgi:uncharacterized protein (DUF58 family)